jgi:hypothetical protein
MRKNVLITTKFRNYLYVYAKSGKTLQYFLRKTNFFLKLVLNDYWHGLPIRFLDTFRPSEYGLTRNP